MQIPSVSSWLVALLLIQGRFASAFPSAPGGCIGGMAAAVGHPSPNPIPSFAQQGYELLVNGEIITDPTALTLTVDSTYEFAIRANATPFRGALIRVDGMGILEAGQNSDLAAVCTTEPGVGHTDNGAKTVLSGMYAVMGGPSVTLDITVVERNDDTSIYSYQQFQLSVEEATPATNTPVAAPTPTPTPPPTDLSGRSMEFWEAILALFRELAAILDSLT